MGHKTKVQTSRRKDHSTKPNASRGSRIPAHTRLQPFGEDEMNKSAIESIREESNMKGELTKE